MTNRFDIVASEMMREFESVGSVNMASLIEAYPEYRADILDLAYWLQRSGAVGPDRVERWADIKGIAESAMLEGVRNLEQAAIVREEVEIAAALQSARQVVAKLRGKGKAPASFRRAVIQTWVFDQLRGNEDRLPRYTTHKTVYIVERALGLGLFLDYKKKAAGPYDPTLRYKDAEPIACKQQWIRAQGSYLVVGPQIRKLYQYVNRYLTRIDVTSRLLRRLALLSHDELETWTTVDVVCQELAREGRTLSVTAVRESLARAPEWSLKLDKPHFGGASIAAAMDHLLRLGMVEISGRRKSDK